MNASSGRRLRVLLVPPMYGGSLPVARFCGQALEELGHMVEVFEAPEFLTAFEALDGLRVSIEHLDNLRNSFLQLVSQAVLAKVETFGPDLVLALAQAPLSRQALKRLKRMNTPTAMWFVEDWQVFTYWRAFAPFYDYFAVIQKEPFLSELKAIGVENGLYLPMAAHPGFHKPLDLDAVQQRKWGGQVAFLGAGYPNRRVAFRALLHHGLKIWGSDWEGDSALRRYVQLAGARISPEDCVKIYNATDINLNLHSSTQSRDLVPGGDFVNPRTFELAAIGAFQLTDERDLLPELFGPDEVATFTSLDELDEKIGYYLEHPEERKAMAAKARERVLAEHTYAHRMETLLEFIRQTRPGWPEERKPDSALSGDMPEELGAEITALLDRLRLAPDTPFEDLVWALRREKGELSGLETAILFLDEWRKQYGS